jgi:hypothetical protein
MMKPGSLAVLSLVLMATLGAAQEGPFRDASRPLAQPGDLGVGRLLPDVSLDDVDAGPTRLSSLLDGRPLVLAVRDPDCPVSRRQSPLLVELQEQYEGRVDFAWLVSLEGVDDAGARRASVDVGLSGRVLRDAELSAAAALGISTTTEALVIDADRTLRYRGAVDDRLGIGFARDEAEHRWLALALDAVLAGGRPTVAATSAPGCVLETPAAPGADGPPTWHADVSRILQEKCVSCHRDGGVAPFALETLAQARAKKGMVRYATDHRIMPPWGAAPGTGPWANDMSLAASEKAALDAWIDAECPEGDPADAPRPRAWPDGWTAGEPDLVYAGPAMEVPAAGVLPYQYFYVRTDQAEDRWVSDIEVMADAPSVVHHVLVFLEAPPAGYDGSVLQRGGGGLHGYWAGYIPGQGARSFAEGQAKLLPAGSWLKFQIHHTADGVPHTDRTHIGLTFADRPPRYEVRTGALSRDDFSLPPRSDDVMVSASGKFGGDAVLSAFSPHMHLRGKAFRYELESPDGETELLLDVPAYDFEWQTMYQLVEPKLVPAGSSVKVTAWFDNSADNPANPDPDKQVWFGEQTWDEMMIGYFEWWRP